MILPARCFSSLNPIIPSPKKSIPATSSSANEKIAPKMAPILRQTHKDSQESNGFCFCCSRRRFLGAGGAALLPIRASGASDSTSNDPKEMLNRIHPPRADWYEEFYAWAMNTFTKAYEAEIAAYKSELFANLRGQAKSVLEIGIGTGPNLKYYSGDMDFVYGIDPNRKMEKYAQAAAETAGLPPDNFKFMQAVSEALPLGDASVDAVVGTLVLCSVKDVDLTLQEVRRVLKPGGVFVFVEHVAAQDGTLHRFVQGLLDPLQQFVADGCHLTRKTGNSIADAGFSEVDIHQVSLSSASLINPHVYGVAHK
nr:methyltransferase-like protein 7B [Ipomoea batatas]